jgi:hypothetical protein
MDASFIASWSGNVQWAQPWIVAQFPIRRLYRRLDCFRFGDHLSGIRNLTFDLGWMSALPCWQRLKFQHANRAWLAVSETYDNTTL